MAPVVPLMACSAERDQIAGELITKPLVSAMMHLEWPICAIAKLAAVAGPFSGLPGFLPPALRFQIDFVFNWKPARQTGCYLFDNGGHWSQAFQKLRFFLGFDGS
jgi:hypothetical protein